MTNNSSLVLQADLIPSVFGDHDLLTVTANITKPKRSLKTFRDLQNYDSETFCSLLLNHSHSLDQILQTENVNAQVSILTNILNDCLNTCSPMVTQQIRRLAAPWMDDNVKQAMKARNDAQAILKRDRLNITLQTIYKDLIAKVKSLINRQRKQYYLNCFQSCKSKSLLVWRTVRDIVPGKCKGPKNNSPDDNESENFNNFFATVGRDTFDETQEEVRNEKFNNVTAAPTTPVSDAAFRPQPVDPNTVILKTRWSTRRCPGQNGIWE